MALCIHGICSQLDIDILLKHPKVFSQHTSLKDTLEGKDFSWEQTLAIELNYSFENYDITCDLVILFHQDSLKYLFHNLSFLLD